MRWRWKSWRGQVRMGVVGRGRGTNQPSWPSCSSTCFFLFLPSDIRVRVSRQHLQGPWLHGPGGPASHPHLCPDTRTQKQPFSVCRAHTLWSASEPREPSLRPLEGSRKSLGCGERGEAEFPHLEETHWSSVRLKLSLPAERASSTVLLNN